MAIKPDIAQEVNLSMDNRLDKIEEKIEADRCNGFDCSCRRKACQYGKELAD